jgi:hypothetical protein
MAPVKKDLRIWRGNDERLAFRLKDGAASPVDLTGSTINITLIHECGKLVLSAVDGGEAVTDPTEGIVIFDLTPAQTRSISPSPKLGARYELEMKTADEQRTLAYGKLIVEGGDNDD